MENIAKQSMPNQSRATTETKSGAMDLQGNIENFKLPDIFQLLASGRKSGTLGMQREDDIVMVYFESGLITYGYGPQQIFHLGRMLKDKGKITEGQLEEAVRKQSKSEENQRLGQTLIELGYIDRADVIEVVSAQVEELLYSLMKWQSGSFKFYEDQYPTQEEITVEISAENVILEGLRRLDEMNHLRDTLPDMNSPLAISQAGAGRSIDVSLSPEEWNLLALIDGQRTLRDIIEISNLSEVESLKKLAALKLAGLITSVAKYADSQAMNDDDSNMTGGTDRLEGMMTRLAGLLEDFLQGSASPSSSSLTNQGQSSRLVGQRPLTEILAESSDTSSDIKNLNKTKADTIESDTTDEADIDLQQQKMWNEFADDRR